MPNRIREVRKAHKMTMKQLGAEVGLAESTISQYETGKREPDNETLLRIGELFGVTVGYLLGAEEKKEKTATVTGDDLDALDIELIGTLKLLSEKERRMILAQTKALVQMRGQ